MQDVSETEVLGDVPNSKKSNLNTKERKRRDSKL